MLKNEDKEYDFPVDLVYLWVDGNDPEWQAKRAAISETAAAQRPVEGESDSVDCKGRYADNDELRYSLRSVSLYAPWIRNIYIVTDNQKPRWLNLDNPKIHIVDHKEILPPSSLPTFNSCVIEHALHLIPGLAEHFIYSNDDTFINRPVTPAHFFMPDGTPIVRFNRRPARKFTLWLKEKVQKKPLGDYNRTIQNSATLVEQHYGTYIGHKTHHNIDAYRKSTYAKVRRLFSSEIDPTMTNHTRHSSDLQRNLYSYAALLEGEARRQFVSQKTSFRLHIDNTSHYAKLERYNPMLFCLNDSQYATDSDRLKVKEYLKRRFPEASEFELPCD